MALIRNGGVFARLRYFCESGAALLSPSVWPVPPGSRHISITSHTGGRVKLNIPDRTTFDTSSIKELPMRYYYNKNPRSPELLGVAEKPRGFCMSKRRVDYYHR